MFLGERKVTAAGEKISYDFEEKINNAVFPGLQGGPHNNNIAGVAAAMLQAQSDEFRKYQEQVLANAKQLAASLEKAGFKVISGGTDVHLLLVDVMKSFNVTGSKASYVLELIDIACNKNTGKVEELDVCLFEGLDPSFSASFSCHQIFRCSSG